VTGLAQSLGDTITIGYHAMSGLERAVAVILLLLLALVGAWAARSDRDAHLRSLRRGGIAATSFLAPGALLVGWFVAVDSNSPISASMTPAAQTMWFLSLSLLGAGMSLLAGIVAYGLGGWLLGRSPRERGRGVIIAIDGPAASGKGTLAKRIAAHLGMAWLDTGLLYRAVARDVIANGGNLEDVTAAAAAARSVQAETLGDQALRGPKAGDAASIVAKIPEVRAALLEYQRSFARQEGGAVLDGRDIGTVVCPDARVKIFVTASDEARARRRFLEHQGRGETVTYEDLLADIRRRDARDSGRSTAPMHAAPDAHHLDTTNLDPDQAFAAAMSIIETTIGRR
jgi:cytidylate kinase